eukprot:750808-Amphidinium_carterae.1
MELGGNRRFLDYMRAQNVPEDMPIREKYSTKAAEWYRRSHRNHPGTSSASSRDAAMCCVNNSCFHSIYT